MNQGQTNLQDKMYGEEERGPNLKRTFLFRSEKKKIESLKNIFLLLKYIEFMIHTAISNEKEFDTLIVLFASVCCHDISFSLNLDDKQWCQARKFSRKVYCRKISKKILLEVNAFIFRHNDTHQPTTTKKKEHHRTTSRVLLLFLFFPPFV